MFVVVIILVTLVDIRFRVVLLLGWRQRLVVLNFDDLVSRKLAQVHPQDLTLLHGAGDCLWLCSPLGVVLVCTVESIYKNMLISKMLEILNLIGEPYMLDF